MLLFSRVGCVIFSTQLCDLFYPVVFKLLVFFRSPPYNAFVTVSLGYEFLTNGRFSFISLKDFPSDVSV